MCKASNIMKNTTEAVCQKGLCLTNIIGKSVCKSIGKSIGKSVDCVEGLFSKISSCCSSCKRPKLPSVADFDSKKISGFFTGGLRKKFGINKSEVKERITLLKNLINNLYLEMGKVGSKIESEENIFDNREVQTIMVQIEKHEKEINSLNRYLAEIEELERKNVPLTEVNIAIKNEELLEGVDKKIQQAISQCIKKAKFSLKSDAIVYQKVLYDLLDKEIDIRRLAVGQLAKIGEKHAAIALKEVLKIQNHQLQAEVINALIQLADGDIFNICKSFLKHDYAAVRAACVRGLYKANQPESIPLINSALQDENAEIRNSAAMFLGWLDARSAVPSLLQATVDPDRRVRLSAISSLANIRDEASVLPLSRILNTDEQDIRRKVIEALKRISGDNFPFNHEANEAERIREIAEFKDWYLRKKHGVEKHGVADEK
ncbi:MAG: HEAT repeat domain-containing protein [Oligoflexia bacterium]|nr:HEAT repeat domain-containing protein [Oligoflexia bacterium]